MCVCVCVCLCGLENDSRLHFANVPMAFTHTFSKQHVFPVTCTGLEHPVVGIEV